MKKQQGNALIATLIVVLVVGILGIVGYLFYQNVMTKNGDSNTPITSTQQENTLTTQEFRSSDHDITFSYPENWSVVEEVQEGNTADWYASSVKVLNAEGKMVAGLSTGGQIGGLCGEDAPDVSISTIIKDSLDLKGIGHTNFGYTIVATNSNNYGVAFGLLKDDLPYGDSAVKCPGMSVNYRYYITSDTKSLGGMTFGLGYAEAQQDGDPNAHRLFESSEEAKAYSQSDEFKQVKTMIESLSIGG
jgi:Tfp pilus assembly major pilin PilA